MKSGGMNIFGNDLPESVRRKAERQKASYVKIFGNDDPSGWKVWRREHPVLALVGASDLFIGPGTEGLGAVDLAYDRKALVVGTIRMGFGHYRIGLALASAARARGLNPFWLDLRSLSHTAGGKVIRRLDALYSLGSRLSPALPPLRQAVWERLNSEGFRRLSYNAVDRKVAEILAAPCRLLPPGIPFIATHAWPAQAAVAAGMKRVVNLIPDNWPMALHLAEGAIHCVQGPSAWQSYRAEGHARQERARPMPPGVLRMVGHYVDHEIVSNLEADTAARRSRLSSGAPLRILLSIGGAGAQKALNEAVIARLLPLAERGKVCLLVNSGDKTELLRSMLDGVPGLREAATVHSGDWAGTAAFAEAALRGSVGGVHLFHDADPFSAVYATNLLMRAADLLVTKPSELAFYPVPKLHLRRVGGHEAWGAIRSAELGDGSIECQTEEEALATLDLILGDGEALSLMNDCILAAHRAGAYDGAYRAVDIAAGSARAGSRAGADAESPRRCRSASVRVIASADCRPGSLSTVVAHRTHALGVADELARDGDLLAAAFLLGRDRGHEGEGRALQNGPPRGVPEGSLVPVPGGIDDEVPHRVAVGKAPLQVEGQDVPRPLAVRNGIDHEQGRLAGKHQGGGEEEGGEADGPRARAASVHALHG
jgi:hypothetical protein